MKISKECWVIMDKTKKAIACGSPRDRRMVLVKNLDTGRILTYNSEKKAISGYTVSGFWDETYQIPQKRWSDNEDTPTYLNETYGEKKEGNGKFGKYIYWSNPDYPEMCIPVKAIISVEFDESTDNI